MNFQSVIKICDPKIWSLLQKHVATSEGTRAYLQVMYYVFTSFLSEAVTVKNRIYYIWYSVFFLRMWRFWLRKTENYSVTEHFISRNSYLCIELNAHSLISAIVNDHHILYNGKFYDVRLHP